MIIEGHALQIPLQSLVATIRDGVAPTEQLEGMLDAANNLLELFHCDGFGEVPGSCISEQLRLDSNAALPHAPEMNRWDVTDELMNAMREMHAIVLGKAEPGKVHHISLPLDIDVLGVRKNTGLSRTAFAEKFALDARALQDWEQGR